MTNPRFRLWDNINKQWLLGYEYENLGGFYMFGECMLFGEYSEAISKYSLDELDELKLMQSLGVKDKNKKEIYEGDVLEWWTPYPEGFPLDKTPQRHLKLIQIKNLAQGCYLFGGHDYEIIGNIYENPELLNENLDG